MMERTEHIDGTWRRPRLSEDDIPEGFIRWWRTVPHEHRHMYLYGGLYSLVEAFNQGRQDEARQMSEQIEQLSAALQVALAYMEDAHRGAALQPHDCEAIARHIRVALRIEP
ncbi:hypothetical protein [Pollutimonas subterranea]|nr:hypothetical protein [Pollutimonas subterranea]